MRAVRWIPKVGRVVADVGALGTRLGEAGHLRGWPLKLAGRVRGRYSESDGSDGPNDEWSLSTMVDHA